ncbi:hypothetical protein CBM2626_U20045 [Cupriavidus taiwanensis]|uniref:Uncharacterized protein n=1 Tax=Cupriavidus taiwanensis TaxID=164546 RepID=A0A375EEY1_9BURK|nr:hypothetical protein CBM2614_U10113 [Cupriavidus taiwanensis]SOZ73430.1 hypothetical protein CBM2615_U10107 [Cupriavidus taiwanensis]SOZ75107.1 hypothetical protein CBM2613_U10009 [Cupriavidus taiwanensis]SPA03829.1 hypothetical protein CBM2626_U20045 [Cupriavidus taiwanensis]
MCSRNMHAQSTSPNQLLHNKPHLCLRTYNLTFKYGVEVRIAASGNGHQPATSKLGSSPRIYIWEGNEIPGMDAEAPVASCASASAFGFGRLDAQCLYVFLK